MHDPSTAAALRDYRQRGATRTFGVVAKLRLLILPILALLALGLSLTDSAPWRSWAAGLVMLVVLAASYYEHVRFRRRGMEARTLPINGVLTALAQLAIVSLTGAIASPFLPAVIVLAALWGVFGSRRQVLGVTWGIQIPTLWLLAFLQAHQIPPAVTPDFLDGLVSHGAGPGVWVATAVYTLMIVVSSTAVMQLQASFLGFFEHTLLERERALRLYEEQTRTMSSLSSEIAHELKNPLASVKGLAALVSRDATGKSAKRLSILRREVDRMQATLEEFLNFSRPLVPLTQENVDLGELTEDVVTLHEGVAAERGVTLQLSAPPSTPLRCDPRKVRQVLVNVLQNAIEASGEGQPIDVEVGAGGGGSLLVRVTDHGGGLPPRLRDRVFDAGVTSKREGSGIGLPVARALARQHGGDLWLEDHPEGGTVAVVELPRDCIDRSEAQPGSPPAELAS